MSTLRPASAKILQHSTGMGAPNADLVRQRAFEIARIDGRSEFHEEDWRQAKRELHGGHEFGDNGNGAEMVSLVSEQDMISADPGHHTERATLEGDESLGEELIAEGMDEAVHERMLAARLKEAEEDEDED